MIDKKKLFKSLIIISIVIVIIIAAIQIRKTLARYETTTTSERNVDVAFWIVDNSFKSESLLIKDVYPTDTPFEYKFTVANFKGNNIAETDMEYELVITTTTNLPLSYEISRNGITCTKGTNVYEEIYEDEFGTCYRKISFGTTDEPYPLIIDTIKWDEDEEKYVKNQITDTYILKVTFPKSYSANADYADLIEDVKIELNARQKID